MRTSDRKPLRRLEYDYSAAGYYFVTVCTVRHMCLLGDVGAGHPAGPGYTSVLLTEYGKIVEDHIRQISNVYPNVTVNKYVVMPNHIHLLLSLAEAGPTGCPAPTSVPKIISALKSLTVRAIGAPIWQRSYHDHIICDAADYERIWTYIDENPARWAEDRYYTLPGEISHP